MIADVIMDAMDLTPEDVYEIEKGAYEVQKASTRRAAQRAKTELDMLLEANRDLVGAQFDLAKSGSQPSFELVDGCSDQERAEIQKLFFISCEVSVAQVIVDNLVARQATWDHRDFLHMPDQAVLEERTNFYTHATHLLRAMELSFTGAVCLDSKFFGPVWRASVDIVKAHPWLLGSGVGASACLGALSGAGLVKLHFGLHHFLVALFGNSSFVAGAAVGGVVGILAGAVIVGFIVLYQRSKMSVADAEAEDLQLMKQRIAKITKKDLDVSDMIELENLFDRAFHQPMLLALDDTMCPICHEHFPAHGGSNYERAIKAPNCQGNHMVHRKCLQDWQRQSGNALCIICRQ